MDITSISSKGQVVIPQKVRERLQIHSGEKFVVIGESDTIVLKKLKEPSFDDFELMLKKAREHATEHDLKSSDVEEAIKKARKK